MTIEYHDNGTHICYKASVAKPKFYLTPHR